MTPEQKIVNYLRGMAREAHSTSQPLHVFMSAQALAGAAERIEAGDHEVYARRIASRDRVVQMQPEPTPSPTQDKPPQPDETVTE